MEKIELRSDGNSLAGKLLIPDGAKKGIVLAHSFRNDMEEPVIEEARKFFSTSGYATLAFDFVGHGKSEGRLREVNYRTISNNLESTIRFLREKGVEKIGFYGISLGTLAFAYANEKVDACILLSPTPLVDPRLLSERYSKDIDSQKDFLIKEGFAKVKSGSGRGFFEMGLEWINDMRHDEGWAPGKIKDLGMPVKVFYGSEDGLAKKEDYSAFVDRFNFPSICVKGADHNFSNGDYIFGVLESSLEFFGEHL